MQARCKDLASPPFGILSTDAGTALTSRHSSKTVHSSVSRVDCVLLLSLALYFFAAFLMAESQDTSSTKSNSSEFLTGNDMWTRWRNFYRMASGNMSPEGQKKYWHDADRRYERVDCKRCESQRDWLLQNSPVIRYMSDNISQLGGDLGKHNMRCRRCDVGQLGGFDPRFGIKLCANYIDTRSKLEDTMAHEMVHAYDHLRFKVDWEGEDLKHVACTEVGFRDRRRSTAC